MFPAAFVGAPCTPYMEFAETLNLSCRASKISYSVTPFKNESRIFLAAARASMSFTRTLGSMPSRTSLRTNHHPAGVT